MSLRLVDLAEIRPADAAVFGGKAAGLARLIAAGVAVPDGFAVEASLDPHSAWAADDRETFRNRVERLLNGQRVAVRSSALGEDSATRSFAGLFETVLQVATAEDALRAADRVRASGAGERVLAYAVGGQPLAAGVVVQRQVEARAAGVCFTRDPAGKDRAIVIEAVPGLGEGLVSGRLPPELWRAYRSGLGGWELRHDTNTPTVLDQHQARAIAEGASQLALRWGHPLDLEWAFDPRGKLFWLQARPITAAAAPPEYVIARFFDGVDDGPVSVWSNWNLREVLPTPQPPLVWTLWKEDVLPIVAQLLFGVPRRSPLFPRSAAIVMEVGGGLCHAAVVARELGIPAVFGITRATELLSDGQLVNVDGDRGRVEVSA